jgi:hypothetical protein
MKAYAALRFDTMDTKGTEGTKVFQGHNERIKALPS